ncbi:MAG: hypothetical protein AAGD96_29850, partial [Chloroflexota bacterium]
MSATLTTSKGDELLVAAISEKREGEYASGDTPRMALFSFLTGLQTGKDDSMHHVILGGVVQAAQAVFDYKKKRNGAPCSLTAAIVNEEQLYTLHIGRGSVLLYKNRLITPVIQKEESTGEGFWLGDGKVTDTFSLAQILISDFEERSSIIVCQDHFANLIQAEQTEFNQVFDLAAAKHQTQSIPSELANWGKSKDINLGLTNAIIHSKDISFVDFFTLNEALLGFDDQPEMLNADEFIDLTSSAENEPAEKLGAEEEPAVEFVEPEALIAQSSVDTIVTSGLNVNDFLQGQIIGLEDDSQTSGESNATAESPLEEVQEEAQDGNDPQYESRSTEKPATE